MAEIDGLEEEFIRKYARKDKQARYLTMLKGRKHRQKFLEGLNHDFDFEPKWATVLRPNESDEEGLLALLRARYVVETCRFMADASELDGRELRLELAVRELFSNHWGTVLICAPIPVAVYRPEDPGHVVLLERPRPGSRPDRRSSR